MASRFSAETIFDRISQEISKTFNELIQQLTLRRDQLLADVETRRNEFELRMKTQEETLKTLENIQSQIEQLTTQQNPASNQIQSSLVPFQKQIDEIIQPPNIKFECPTDKITETLMKLGSILLNDKPVLTINYFSKVRASQVITCKYPDSLYVYSTDVYVLNGSSIQVFDAKDWSSKHVIGEEDMSFKAVVADEHHYYAIYSNWKGGYRYFISKCDKSTRNVIRSELFDRGYLKIVGMARLENEIFIAIDRGDIHVFDTDLNPRRRFELNKVRCIQFKDDSLYVLDDSNSLTIFNSSLQKIGTSHQFFKPLTNQNSEGEGEGEVKAKLHNMRSFCFDPSGNAILTSGSNKVIVQSPNGEELYTIGANCQCNEELSYSTSIGVYGDKILVACYNLNCIKIF